MKNIKKYVASLLMLIMLFNVSYVLATDVSDQNVLLEQDLEAINRLDRLKILNLIEQENLDPSAAITREELANVAANMLSIENTAWGDVENNITDIDNCKYKAQIQNLIALGILSGVNNYEFKPDGPVAYNAAVKVLVSVLGYQPQAEAKGGYPGGYMRVANEIDLPAINVIDANSINWGEFAELVEACFEIPIQVVSGIGKYITYSVDENATFLSAFHDVKMVYGTVTDNGITTKTGKSKVGVESVVVGGITMLKGKTDIENAFGVKVKCWYRDEPVNTALFYEIDDKSKKLVITAEDIKNTTKTEITYKAGDKSRKAVVNQYADVIYNGASYPDYTKEDFDLDNGKLILYDNDSGDAGYDLVIIEEYESCVVSSVDVAGNEIWGYYGEEYDLDQYDVRRVLNSAYDDIELSAVKKEQVASVYKSKNKECIRVVVSSETVTGVISEMSDDGEKIYYISENAYKLSKSLENKIKNKVSGIVEPELGMEYKLYLDIEGYIAGLISGNIKEVYAYLTDVAECTDLKYRNLAYARLFLQTGDFLTVKTAKKITINDSASKVPGKELAAIPELYSGMEVKPQLVKVEINSAGDLISIKTAGTELNDYGYNSEEFTKCHTSSSGYWRYGIRTMDGYVLHSDAPVFMIPKSMDEEDFYVIKPEEMINSSTYKYDVELYDLDSSLSANAVVIKTSKENSVYDSNLFAVERVRKFMNYGGEYVYLIAGYMGKNHYEYAELKEGIIDAAIPEGIKVGDVIKIELKSGKTVFNTSSTVGYLSTVPGDKMISGVEKLVSLDDLGQYPCGVLDEAAGADHFAVYGPIYGKSKAAITVITNQETKTLDKSAYTSNGAHFIYDVEEKTFTLVTYDDINSNTVVYQDGTADIDWSNIVFVKKSSGSSVLTILLKR